MTLVDVGYFFLFACGLPAVCFLGTALLAAAALTVAGFFGGAFFTDFLAAVDLAADFFLPKMAS